MRRMAMVAAAMVLGGAAKPPQERVVAGDGIVDATLNGEPIRLRVDPAAPGMPLMADAIAVRRGFKLDGKWGIGFGFRVGATTVNARTKVARVGYGQAPEKQRVGWTPRAFANVADGTVGPGGLPEPIVRFVLHPARAGERTVTLPMEKPGFPMTLFGGGWMASIGIVEVGGAPMRIRFDPYHPRTLATAGAAVRLAQAYGGALSGEAVPTEIFFGVERPVRTLTLARPFPLGALAITQLGARTGDAGLTAAIRDADAAEPAADPDEILVVAKGKPRDLRRDTVSIGADQLAQCSSIVFDKPAHVIRLTCG